MIDLYNDILHSSRTVERATPLYKIVEMLYVAGYDDTLDEIIIHVGSDEHYTLADIIVPIESLIIKSANAFLLRLGVDVDRVNINTNPAAVEAIMAAIITDIESFDDYDSLLDIIDSEESNEVKLADVVATIHNSSSSTIVDIVDNVSDKLMRVIQSALIGKRLVEREENEAADLVTANRIALFLSLYPDNRINTLLDSYGYKLPLSTLIEQIELDHDSVNFVQDVAITAVGIVAAKYSEYEQAYEQLETVIDLLLDNDNMDSRKSVARASVDALAPLYVIETDGDEDE